MIETPIEIIAFICIILAFGGIGFYLGRMWEILRDKKKEDLK